MANAPAKFTKVDVKRALQAVQAIDPAMTIRIYPDGSIVAVKAPDATPRPGLDASSIIAARIAALRSKPQ